MARSFVTACLLFAGIWMLASPGWALIAGAFLVFALWRPEPDWHVAGVAARAWALRVWARVMAAPRRAVAASGMTSAVLLLPTGFGLAMGAGAALIAAAAGLAAVSLLTGWGS